MTKLAGLYIFYVMDKIYRASEDIKLSVPSHPRHLQLVRVMIKKIVHIIGFSEDDSGSIILAVDEACSNIIKHSYMNDPKKRIDLCIGIKEKEFKIHITDYGKQCDIRWMQPRNIDDVSPGGLGIYIMNQVMDSVKFDCSSPRQNRLTMIKRMGVGSQSA